MGARDWNSRYLTKASCIDIPLVAGMRLLICCMSHRPEMAGARDLRRCWTFGDMKNSYVFMVVMVVGAFVDGAGVGHVWFSRCSRLHEGQEWSVR